MTSPAPGRTADNARCGELPDALRTALADEAVNLAVSLTEAVLADGLGFKGPFEEFGRIAEPLLLDALGAARRDGAQIANEAAAPILAQLRSDLAAARKERDEATRLLRVLNEETVLAGYPCGDRDRTLANVRVLRSDLIALAKMYGEACGELQLLRGDEHEARLGAEECCREAASLRSQLQEAQKAGEGSGRDPGGSGSRPSDQAASHPAPAGFDPSRMQWQPIATAPKDGRLILLWSGIVMRAGWWFEDDEAWRVGGDTILRAPTHWMPLPSPPALGIEAAVPPEPKGPAEGKSPTPQGGMPDLTPIPATKEAGDHEPR